MREKYLTGKFGTCPRVLCEKQNVIPIGISEDSKIARVKVYCPRCKDIYSPKKKPSDVDGSFFGTSFPHLLLMVNSMWFRHSQILALTSQKKNMYLRSSVSKLRRNLHPLLFPMVYQSPFKNGSQLKRQELKFRPKRTRKKKNEMINAMLY